jgi:hypothetical protein
MQMNIIKQILNDTLKRDGKWSRTSLTMFTSWFIALVMAILDFFFNGLRFDVWLGLISVSIGSKISDSLSKKIHDDTGK